jgi:hypothetical protein
MMMGGIVNLYKAILWSPLLDIVESGLHLYLNNLCFIEADSISLSWIILCTLHGNLATQVLDILFFIIL